MPRRKNYRRRKRYVRRGRRKRKRKWRRRPRAIAQGFASSFVKGRITKMVYHQRVILSSIGGAMSTYTWRANSIYDPDYTSLGHQPRGHDQWELLYANYLVVGSRINIRATFAEGAGTVPYTYGVLRSRSASNPFTNANGCIEESGKYRLWRGGVDTGVLRQGYGLKRFFNIKDPKDNITRFGAPFGSNPSEEAFFHVWVAGDGLDDAYARFEVTIQYVVLLSDAKTFAQS